MAIDQFTPHEEWRIVSCSDAYEVSNLGRVRRRIAGRLSPAGRIVGSNIKRNYSHVSLCQDGRVLDRSIHVLVALAFLGPRPVDRRHINHIDGNKHNNAVWNLEYVTPQENNRHANRTGLNPVACEDNPATRLSNRDVMSVRAKYLSGHDRKSIASEYQITQTTLTDILAGNVFKGLGLTPLKRPSLKDVVMLVLIASSAPLQLEEIHARAVVVPRDNAKGECSISSIKAACCALVIAGVIDRAGRGCYTFKKAA